MNAADTIIRLNWCSEASKWNLTIINKALSPRKLKHTDNEKRRVTFLNDIEDPVSDDNSKVDWQCR